MTPSAITPAALMVTATLCLVTLIVAIAVAVDFARQSSLDPQGAQLLLGLVGVTGSLLARTFRDPQPTGQPGDPVAVDVEDGRPRRALHRADGTSTLDPQ